MQMIYEKDIEGSDYLEILLSTDEYKNLFKDGVCKDFPFGLNDRRSLNVFLRVDSQYNEDEDMPLVKGAKAKTKKGFSENVKREMEAGKPQKQAVAIAYSEARGAKKKGKK